MLTELGRGDDYIELSLDGRLTWNPRATWLDSYSLAYTVASLLNQLFGKGKEPFWQQAYTNLVRWIIELHRVLPGGWATLRPPSNPLHPAPLRSQRAAVEILDAARTLGTVDRLRSPPRAADHPRQLVEAALAHVVQNKVEAAYARSDLFERRRKLMTDWAAYLNGERRADGPPRR